MAKNKSSNGELAVLLFVNVIDPKLNVLLPKYPVIYGPSFPIAIPHPIPDPPFPDRAHIQLPVLPFSLARKTLLVEFNVVLPKLMDDHVEPTMYALSSESTAISLLATPVVVPLLAAHCQVPLLEIFATNTEPQQGEQL